jgi:competence protein ComGC
MKSVKKNLIKRGNIMVKNEKGFTLIEMLIVLLVISVLLLITIPNITKHHSNIQAKGCEGLKNTVQAQSTAYQIEHKAVPTMEDLKTEKYIEESPVCPNGTELIIDGDGKVAEKTEE